MICTLWFVKKTSSLCINFVFGSFKLGLQICTYSRPRKRNKVAWQICVLTSIHNSSANRSCSIVRMMFTRKCLINDIFTMRYNNSSIALLSSPTYRPTYPHSRPIYIYIGIICLMIVSIYNTLPLSVRPLAAIHWWHIIMCVNNESVHINFFGELYSIYFHILH